MAAGASGPHTRTRSHLPVLRLRIMFAPASWPTLKQYFPRFANVQHNFLYGCKNWEDQECIPAVSAWLRQGSELDWEDVPRERHRTYISVLWECDIMRINREARDKSQRLFKMLLLSLGSDKTNVFAQMPRDVLEVIHMHSNPEPTTMCMAFERRMLIVANDGLLTAKYLSVDLSPHAIPLLYNEDEPSFDLYSDGDSEYEEPIGLIGHAFEG
jgi:hypothetical protein